MQIRVPLPPATHEALSTLAILERRDAKETAALLIIAALSRRGLVSRDGLVLPEEPASRSANRIATAAVADKSR